VRQLTQEEFTELPKADKRLFTGIVLQTAPVADLFKAREAPCRAFVITDAMEVRCGSIVGKYKPLFLDWVPMWLVEGPWMANIYSIENGWWLLNGAPANGLFIGARDDERNSGANGGYQELLVANGCYGGRAEISPDSYDHRYDWFEISLNKYGLEHLNPILKPGFSEDYSWWQSGFLQVVEFYSPSVGLLNMKSDVDGKVSFLRLESDLRAVVAAAKGLHGGNSISRRQFSDYKANDIFELKHADDCALSVLSEWAWLASISELTLSKAERLSPACVPLFEAMPRLSKLRLMDANTPMIETLRSTSLWTRGMISLE
jgi:hypothetical protein